MLATIMSKIPALLPDNVNLWYATALVAGAVKSYLEKRSLPALASELMSGAAMGAASYWKIPYRALGVVAVSAYVGWIMLKRYLAMKKRKMIPSGLTALARLKAYTQMATYRKLRTEAKDGVKQVKQGVEIG
ncbi:unnamed protein product [Strongylus vulgaris]|uniref:Uncharacterized protein n=1 Tax=Strongylus vulgaris TaxID=40348 RepID=A0A3P7LE18_STRVU|nr:unnamed protein product [Strongylus vulgaris]